MFKNIVFIIIIAFAQLVSHGQNLINQYEDLTGEQLPNYNPGTSYYFGEFQVFLDELNLEFSSAVGNSDYVIWYEVECVSFPFQTPVWNEMSALNRWMVMPAANTYSLQTSDFNNLLDLVSYNHSGSTDEFPVHSYYVNSLITNENYSVSSTQKSTLISAQCLDADQASYAEYNPNRVNLPHSILKFTFHFQCQDDELFNFEFLVDLTRGELRNYPFLNNFSSSTNFANYDLQIRPRFVVNPSGHDYETSSNEGFMNQANGGTINYFSDFPYPTGDYDPESDLCSPHLFPSAITLNYNGDNLIPPPYALLDAPVLNAYATSYAGYVNSPSGAAKIEPLVGSDYSSTIPWEFFLDRPFDISLINANERVVYLPQSLHIGDPVFDGQALPANYNGVHQVFPSGYTFKTIYGKYPHKDAYDNELALGYAEDYKYCHPESDVSDSEIIIESGSSLTIEDCVRIMDCTIIVKSGGTLNYASSRKVGNYIVLNDGGTINDVSSVNDYALFCSVECSNTANYDALNLVVSEGISQLINSDFAVYGDVIIENGGVLNITAGGQLFMGPEARIIVQNGGILNVNNATITSACDAMWRGIEVWSLEDLTNEIPGQVYLNNAHVLNAHIGSVVAKTQLPNINSTIASDGGSFTMHSDGGLLVSDGTIYENCGIGIMYPKGFHQAVPDDAHVNSLIENNTFVTTGVGLMDMRYNRNHSNPYPTQDKPWFGNANSETRGSAGILISNIKGLTIGNDNSPTSNTFQNLEVGVRQFGANCDVINNVFDELQYGVYISSSSHFWNTTKARIEGNQFTNIYDPNPIELLDLPYPDGEYLNQVTLVPVDEMGNSACIRLDGMKNVIIAENIFGVQIGAEPSENGIYCENVSGLVITGNGFNQLKRGVILWDSDDTDLNQALIGMQDLSEERNLFFHCESNILLGGVNSALLVRCNTFQNNPATIQKNLMNRGVLGDQGSLPEETDENDTAAGNQFILNLSDVYSLGEDALLQEYNANLELNNPEAGTYSGWAYYHYTNDDHIPTVVNENMEVTVGSVGLPYSESTSCSSPYEIVADDGNGQQHVLDLDELTEVWEEEIQFCENLLVSLDNFHASTQTLLNAIYGGITNEAELADFLSENSPLSNEVLEAYMQRANVPLSYLTEIIALNGELDQELHLLLGQKIENLPDVIVQQINQLCMNNPLVKSVAESRKKIKYLNRIRQAVLADAVSFKMQQRQIPAALALLENENDVVKNSACYKLRLSEQNLSAAGDALLDIPLQSEKIESWVQDGKQLIFWLQSGQAYGNYDPTTIAVLKSRLLPDPNNDSYTTNKYFWGPTGEFPMYYPTEPPEERSARATGMFSENTPNLVYPNPANSYVRINHDQFSDSKAIFQLFDLTGRLVFEQTFDSSYEDPIVQLFAITAGPLYVEDLGQLDKSYR